jgi:hypothetical protein
VFRKPYKRRFCKYKTQETGHCMLERNVPYIIISIDLFYSPPPHIEAEETF